jgi:sugar phosphate isomerase/epimerase
MKLGVVGIIPADPRQVDETALAAVREAGFTGCSLILPAPEELSTAEVERLRDAFGRAGVAVAQVNARYPDLVQADGTQRRAGIAALIASVRVAAALAAGTVYVRPGSLNPAGSWTPHPENTATATLERLAVSLREVCRVAEDLGARLALEGHVVSPLATPEQMQSLIARVDSPALGFNADPVNFIGTLDDLYHSTAFLDRFFDVLAPVTVAAHAKDVTVADRLVLHIDETVPGRGRLDQEHFLRRFEAACPEGWVLIEHLRTADIPEARDTLLRAAERAGLTWR